MFNPENGPARLFRWTETMPLPDIVSMYFEQQNLLLIDKEHFEKLSDEQRHILLRTEQQVMKIHYPPNKPPFVSAREDE